MNSPFFWRNLLVLSFLIANFAVGFYLLVFPPAFVQNSSALRASFRAASVLYASVSLIILLVAFSFFHDFEISASSREIWKTRHHWSEIKTGMTKAQVVEILGEPSMRDIWTRNDERFHYALHPFDGVSVNAVLFNADSPSDAEKKVVEKYPTDEELNTRLEWLPDKNSNLFSAYRDTISGSANMFAFGGIMLIVMLAFVPFGFRGDWNSLTLYAPLAALVFALIYEKTITVGWRFDFILLFPAYALIFLGWLIRIIIAFAVARKSTPS